MKLRRSLSLFANPGELTSRVQRFPQRSWLTCESDCKYTYDQVGNRLSSLTSDPSRNRWTPQPYRRRLLN